MQRLNHSSLTSILSQIDNWPQWFTLKHFRRQLLKFMVKDCDYIAEELDEHLKKSTHSYQDICMHLARAQKPGDAIHLIVSATSLMLNIPILMVYPVQLLDRYSGHISYEYKECLPVVQWHVRPGASIQSN